MYAIKFVGLWAKKPKRKPIMGFWKFRGIIGVVFYLAIPQSQQTLFFYEPFVHVGSRNKKDGKTWK